MAEIHPTALVDPKARIDADVEIGPYCIIGQSVPNRIRSCRTESMNFGTSPQPPPSEMYFGEIAPNSRYTLRCFHATATISCTHGQPPWWATMMRSGKWHATWSTRNGRSCRSGACEAKFTPVCRPTGMPSSMHLAYTG